MGNIGDLFSDFFSWMQALPAIWAYVTILVIAYGENVVPPIPGDMIVVFGGYLAGIGKLHLGIVVLLSTIGGALGFMSMYAIGYRLGKAVLDPDRLTWIPQEKISKAQQWLHRWGYGVVVANRFLSGARSVISLTVGMAQMSPWQTAWWCTVSAAVWTALISYAGYKVGENWQLVARYLRAYGRFVLAALALLALGLLVRAYWRRKAQPAESKRQSAKSKRENMRKNDGSSL